MSAAAGISAAKKRRGVVSTGPEVQTPSQNSKQGQAQPMFTPIQILQNHELRLKHIEKQLSDADDYANSMGEQQQQPPQAHKPGAAHARGRPHRGCWKDPRSATSGPRRGLRTASGTIRPRHPEALKARSRGLDQPARKRSYPPRDPDPTRH